MFVIVGMQLRPFSMDLLVGLFTLKKRSVDEFLLRWFQLDANGSGKDIGDTFFAHQTDLFPRMNMFRHIGDDSRMETEKPIRYVHFALQENIA